MPVDPCHDQRNNNGLEKGRKMRVAIAAVLMSSVLLGASEAAADEPVFVYGPSDADSIAVLSGLPGDKNQFWWDHPNLTVAVRAAPNADGAKLQALHNAIGVWSTTLAILLPEISLTDVTHLQRSGNPDIILHYVPHAGGVVWGGLAVCGVQKCRNVIVRSDEPPGGPYADFDTLRIQREALHELGHALGLGHVAPLETSRDIMGYGWAIPDPNLVPILSECDLDGIRAAFSWLFAGEAPHPSPVAMVICGK
jgi:hypothetical protein